MSVESLFFCLLTTSATCFTFRHWLLIGGIQSRNEMDGWMNEWINPFSFFFLLFFDRSSNFYLSIDLPVCLSDRRFSLFTCTETTSVFYCYSLVCYQNDVCSSFFFILIKSVRLLKEQMIDTATSTDNNSASTAYYQNVFRHLESLSLPDSLRLPLQYTYTRFYQEAPANYRFLDRSLFLFPPPWLLRSSVEQQSCYVPTCVYACVCVLVTEYNTRHSKDSDKDMNKMSWDRWKNSLVREGSFLHIFSALVMKTSFQGRAFSLPLCCQSRKKETKTREEGEGEGESPLNECMIELMWGKREKSLDDLVKTIIYECIRNGAASETSNEREKSQEKDTERKEKTSTTMETTKTNIWFVFFFE